MACNACMSMELFERHTCKEQSLGGVCPVCSDRLFDSKHPIKELPCGHFMHSGCFAAYTRYSYSCPVCSKSLGDMSVYWRMIDSLLAAERLPPEYGGRTQAVLCSDCGAAGDAPFHFVYHKCGRCGSYNTRVL
jgi:zinc finger-like protein